MSVLFMRERYAGGTRNGNAWRITKREKTLFNSWLLDLRSQQYLDSTWEENRLDEGIRGDRSLKEISKLLWKAVPLGEQNQLELLIHLRITQRSCAYATVEAVFHDVLHVLLTLRFGLVEIDHQTAILLCLHLALHFLPNEFVPREFVHFQKGNFERLRAVAPKSEEILLRVVVGRDIKKRQAYRKHPTSLVVTRMRERTNTLHEHALQELLHERHTLVCGVLDFAIDLRFDHVDG